MIYRFGGYDPFGKVPLSAADPELFRTTFTPILAQLEAEQITLAAFELGNEINLSKTNPEFPVPGKGGVQLSLNELHHDVEGQQIAKGFLQYLKILTVLKDMRDHSKLNQHTPIMSAGLGSYEQADGRLPKGVNVDIVGVNTTLAFMRANGLDNLVDAYGIHIYPASKGPGDPKAAAARKDKLANFDLAVCRPAGSADGKPCWITEWGFANANYNCPTNDANQASLVRETMGNYRPYVQQGRLVGLLYFAWNDLPGMPPSGNTVWRCGSLTESGRLSIDANLLR